MSSNSITWRVIGGALVAAAGLFAGGMAYAAEQGVAHGSHPRKAATVELGTSALMDGASRLWVVTKELDGDGKPMVALRQSSDLGRSWSPPRQVVQDAVTARGEERPRIALGAKGEIFILYTSPLTGYRNPHVGNIRFVRSTDGGKTFSEPLTVHAHRQDTVHAFGNMVVDKAGNLYVVWIDGRDAALARQGQQKYAGSAIYYAVSRDGGLSFSGDYKIADHSCECCRIALVLGPRGRPIAMWRHVFEGDIRDHAMAELRLDGKAEEIQRVTFDDWHIEACPHHGPALAWSEDGTRHQVWFNGKEDDAGGALYGAASAGGRQSKPVTLGSAQASHPDVATRGRRVAVAWKQFDGESTAVLMRVSDDGGSRWKQEELARTRGDSDRPRLISASQGIFLVWRTQDEGLRVLRVGKEGT